MKFKCTVGQVLTSGYICVIITQIKTGSITITSESLLMLLSSYSPQSTFWISVTIGTFPGLVTFTYMELYSMYSFIWHLSLNIMI